MKDEGKARALSVAPQFNSQSRRGRHRCVPCSDPPFESVARSSGSHIAGPEAGTLIHEVAVAMAGPLPADVIRHTIHAFPTHSGAVRWAAGGVPVDKAERVGCVLCVREVSPPDAVVA